MINFKYITNRTSSKSNFKINRNIYYVNVVSLLEIISTLSYDLIL